MAIPQNPMLFGAIAPTTANMLAQAGQELTERIETQNLRFEAQAKAPQIGKMYAESLSRIARGDFEGFKGISAATAAGAGNPFLQSIFKDFDSASTRLADSFMDREAATARLGQAETLQDARIKASEAALDKRLGAQAATQASIQERQITALEASEQRQIEREREQLYRQQVASFEREKAAIDKQHQDELEQVRLHNLGQARMKELDPSHTMETLKPPTKPKYPDPPQRETFIPSAGRAVVQPQADGLMANLSEDPLDIANLPPMPSSTKPLSPANAALAQGAPSPMIPVGTSAPRVEPPLPTKEAPPPQATLVNEDESPGGGAEAVYSEEFQKVMEAVTKQAARTNAQPSKNGRIERQMGSAIIDIDGYVEGARAMDIDETVKTLTGSKGFKSKGELPPANRLAIAINTIQSLDPELGIMFAHNIREGNHVFIDPQPAKGDEVKNQAYAMDRDGKKVPLKIVNVPKVVAAFDEAKTLMNGEMKGKFSIRFRPLEEKAARGQLVLARRVALGKITLDEGNDFNAQFGVPPVTQKQVDEEKVKIEAEKVQAAKVAKEEKEKAEAEASRFGAPVEVNPLYGPSGFKLPAKML